MTRVKAHKRKVGRKVINVKAHNRRIKRKRRSPIVTLPVEAKGKKFGPQGANLKTIGEGIIGPVKKEEVFLGVDNRTGELVQVTANEKKTQVVPIGEAPVLGQDLRALDVSFPEIERIKGSDLMKFQNDALKKIIRDAKKDPANKEIAKLLKFKNKMGPVQEALEANILTDSKLASIDPVSPADSIRLFSDDLSKDPHYVYSAEKATAKPGVYKGKDGSLTLNGLVKRKILNPKIQQEMDRVLQGMELPSFRRAFIGIKDGNRVKFRMMDLAALSARSELLSHFRAVGGDNMEKLIAKRNQVGSILQRLESLQRELKGVRGKKKDRELLENQIKSTRSELNQLEVPIVYARAQIMNRVALVDKMFRSFVNNLEIRNSALDTLKQDKISNTQRKKAESAVMEANEKLRNSTLYDRFSIMRDEFINSPSKFMRALKEAGFVKDAKK